jgi:hypothetical protein
VVHGKYTRALNFFFCVSGHHYLQLPRRHDIDARVAGVQKTKTQKTKALCACLKSQYYCSSLHSIPVVVLFGKNQSIRYAKLKTKSIKKKFVAQTFPRSHDTIEKAVNGGRARRRGVGRGPFFSPTAGSARAP